jgi:uncharacterized protein YndB with AHSA1/START domain
MKAKPFVIEKIVDAPVDRVWKAITDKDDMKQWYFDLAEFKPEVGFEFQFEGQNEERVFVHLCKVTEVVPRKKLTYSWRYKDHEGNSFVTFELSDESGKTKVKLTHAGLETFPPLADFAKESFVAGWTEIIGIMLPAFVERAAIKKVVTLKASPEKVWNVLMTPDLIRQWAAAFHEGTYVETDWKKGSPVLWKDKDGDVGAHGVVVINNPNMLLKVDFYDDVNARPPATTGEYSETYILQPLDGKTELTIYSGLLSVKNTKAHSPLWDKAIALIKEIAEK